MEKPKMPPKGKLNLFQVIMALIKNGTGQKALILMMLVQLINQESVNAQQLRGSNSAQINLGFTDTGLSAGLYYVRTFDPKLNGMFGGTATYLKVYDIQYKALYLDGIASYTVQGVKGNARKGAIFMNVTGGVSLVSEHLSAFESDRMGKQLRLDYGAILGAEMQLELSRRTSLLINGSGRYLIRGINDKGHFRPQVQIGIRYTI